MSRVLVVDNFDSFTYNLVQLLGELGAEIVVRRNDAVTAGEADALEPTHLLISPGPGGPEDGGVSSALIQSFRGRIPVLGVCLGHQILAHLHGASIVRADLPRHGKVSPIDHRGDSIFDGLDSPLEATRYHSLVVDRGSLPPVLEVTAWTEDGTVMGLVHAADQLHGVQFHPESIATKHGRRILENFLALR